MIKSELIDTSTELKKSDPYARPVDTRRVAVEKRNLQKQRTVEANEFVVVRCGRTDCSAGRRRKLWRVRDHSGNRAGRTSKITIQS